MPNKFNEERRHHIPKRKMSVRNWAEYESGLKRRGSLTLWLAPEALNAWSAARRTTPGGQSIYSNTAIETCLILRSVFKLPLRQAEGLMVSICDLLVVSLQIPDHTTVSRRAVKFPCISLGKLPEGPLDVLIDSTGLKVFGAGEWLTEKHGKRSRRSWRKLHLAVDANTSEVLALVLTMQEVDDPSQVGPLLDKINGNIISVIADGAYDGQPTYDIIAQKNADIKVVIPPRSTAVQSQNASEAPTQRDRHVASVAADGRLNWQNKTGYGKRSLVETAMGRFKSIIGNRLRARNFEGQKTEASIGVLILNTMLAVGRPNSVRNLKMAV